MGSLAKKLSGQSQQVKMYAKGGKVKNDDTAADKVLIKKMIDASEKKEDAKPLKKGGPVSKPMMKKGGKCG